MIDSALGPAGQRPGVVATTASLPANPYLGQLVFVTDIKTTLLWTGTWTSVVLPGNRNLIDNSLMRINQRAINNTTMAASTEAFISDRWRYRHGWAVSHVGYGNYAGAVSGYPIGQRQIIINNGANSRPSPAAGEYDILSQYIEGYRLQELMWGTASAKECTATILMYLTTAASMTLGLSMDSPTACRVSKSIAASAGWGLYRVTFPANTLVAPANDNSFVVSLELWLGAGTTYNSGSLGDLNTSWVINPAANTRAAGQTNIWTTTNQQINVAAVQLEVGPTSTPFEVIPITEDLQRCQRYFQRWQQPPLRGGVDGNLHPTRMAMVLPVEMRTTPVSSQVGEFWFWDGGGAASTSTAPSSTFTTGKLIEVEWTTHSAGLTAYRPCMLYQNGGAGYLDLNADA